VNWSSPPARDDCAKFVVLRATIFLTGAPVLSLGTTKLAVQRVLRGLFAGIRRSKRVAKHTVSCTAKVNAWRYSTALHTLSCPCTQSQGQPFTSGLSPPLYTASKQPLFFLKRLILQKSVGVSSIQGAAVVYSIFGLGYAVCDRCIFVRCSGWAKMFVLQKILAVLATYQPLIQ
jgi:hypothetical protein